MSVVLVGETNQALNAEMCNALEKVKLESQPAFTGEEVVYYTGRAVRGYAEPVSLIVCDINIRGLSGFGVLGKLSSMDGANRIPTVVTVEKDLTSVLDDGFEMGVFGFFVKPMNMRKAAVTIKAIVNGDSATLKQAAHSHADEGAIVTRFSYQKKG